MLTKQLNIETTRLYKCVIDLTNNYILIHDKEQSTLLLCIKWSGHITVFAQLILTINYI